MTVNVSNAAPSTPVDSDGATGGTVAEDAANGTAVGITADASDPGGGSVSYALTDDAGGRFQINAGTGVVTVADTALIDHESATSHTVSLRASDDDGVDSGTASFTVGVTDVDSPPTFSATGPFSVSESAGDGSVAGDVDAVDGDGGAVDAGLTYAITGGNGGGAFAIDNSGALQVADASLIDFESAAAFTLTVEANDNNSTTPANVTVNVTDEPPGPPADTDGAADAVAEDAANGTTVGIDVEATDPAGGTVSYVLVNDAGGRFAIDGNGVVAVADSAGLDFESVTSHTIGIEARDSDGSASATLSTVITITDAPDDPTVTAPPDLAGSNAVDASGLYTQVDLGRDGDATASDDEDGTLTPEPESVDNPAWLRPGTNTITWSVTDSSGASASEDQIVEVRPRAALGVDRTVQEGTTVELSVELNGNAIDGTSPMVDFDVSGSSTATGADYAGFVAPGSITLMSRTGTLDFDVLADGTAGEPPETLVIETTGASEAALAERTQTTVTLTEENQPPLVTLSAAQSGGADPAVVIDKSAGNMTVSADTSDATATGSMTFDWTASGLTDTDGAANNEIFVFDPSALSAGLYTLSVEAGDNGSPVEAGQARIALRVLDSLPALGSSDTDKDGLNDNDPDEGRADRDGDLIPDYRDPYRDANTLHQALSDNAGYRLETEPGLNLALGAVAFAADAEGARVTADEIATVTGWRDERTNVGGRFDFTLYGLPHPRANAHVVIPQRAAIPEQAVYRLTGVVGSWQTFASNPENALASAPGAPGYCPPPDDPAFTTGLSPGDHCVRLTLEDGGVNDADGHANGRIRSTGGMARKRPTPEENQAPERVEVESSGGVWSPVWLWILGVFMTLRLARSRETG